MSKGRLRQLFEANSKAEGSRGIINAVESEVMRSEAIDNKSSTIEADPMLLWVYGSAHAMN